MVPSGRRRSRSTFAQVVSNLPEREPSPAGMEAPAVGRSWVDADGTHWVRRGDGCTPSRARRLLAADDVRVVHVDAGEVREVAPAGRSALRARIEPYLQGARREQGDHTDVVVTEFRAEGRRLLVVEERC